MRSALSKALGAAALVAAFSTAGCDKKDASTRDAPPGPSAPAPSSEAAKPGACKDGGGQVKDAIAAPFFPRQSGEYCVNPEGETKAFGDKAPKAVDGICNLFDGGCELYRTNQVKRLVTVDYVDGAGSPGTVNAILSQYATADNAFAMFTKRVAGDEDPVRGDMPKKVDAGGPMAAMGTGTIYAVKGMYLLELSYVNTEEDEKRMRATGEKVLPPLAKDILAKLPAAPPVPPAAAKLPTENLVPLGIAYATQNALGVDGTGAGAQGFYKDGDKRFRVLAIVKDDADQAKDVLKTFGKRKGATEEKGVGEGAGVRLMMQENKDDPKSEWVLGRQGTTVFGIGDEPLAVKQGASAADFDKINLSKDDKLKRLRALLAAKLGLRIALRNLPGRSSI